MPIRISPSVPSLVKLVERMKRCARRGDEQQSCLEACLCRGIALALRGASTKELPVLWPHVVLLGTVEFYGLAKRMCREVRDGKSVKRGNDQFWMSIIEKRMELELLRIGATSSHDVLCASWRDVMGSLIEEGEWVLGLIDDVLRRRGVVEYWRKHPSLIKWKRLWSCQSVPWFLVCVS